MDTTIWIPKWQKELMSFKGIKSTFIVEGNISDIYPSFQNDGEFCSLNRIIANIFDSDETKGLYDFQYCDPIFGFSDPLNFNKATDMIRLFEEKTNEKQREIQAINGKDRRENHSGISMVRNSEIIRTSMTVQTGKADEARKSIVNTINFASRFLSSPDNMSIDETTFFLNLLFASNNAIRINKNINTLILIVSKFNDIPAWFFLNNPNVRTITIPNPDRNIRSMYIEKNYKIFSEDASPETSKMQTKFVDLTEGMKILELGELRRLYDKSNIPPEEIADVVSIYKYGFKENKWAQIRGKLDDDIPGIIKKRVKGQEQAIEKIVRVIKRAVVGLSGLQHSSNTKPRGILFLAGPTGTGKTEIVKTVTALLFEDEKTLIRFDMSEYTAEHADQKLFGAPPGYVGYDNGGQLTNAVKNNPFSVLLFDEIEKAHPNIMDKFLQILEDGRMTDGQGNTVYFTETLIFFTSNVGISREIIDPHTGKVVGRENIVSPGEPYSIILEKVEEAMKTYFKPEVINRIGENIVVFNYIDQTASQEIAKSQIVNINNNLQKNNKINITIGEDAYKLLYSFCWQDKPRSNGGRGIGNVIEEQYLNPLAEFIFDNNCQETDAVSVKTKNGALVFVKG
ncbi:MAG: AAA family ATPase [Treponema sp.]|nr:AAA family ATPase [Treponema sp.]